ncbi:acyl-CoA dehydrogenase [Microbacterium sp. Root1433D1]|uniref:acyl-CoA dehydrogenase family protein n=1 Tax=Microbacterium sp. Root1433D1 TaxID=1736463 RepID=UPI0006F56E13|nr:acyl-CoA dehydrogenase family protein [Microbacterium sp. Root1433D1]KQY78126.1 acyl-CoA dehydrogenase [Microbacterium sp. Root1433D1]
MSAHASVAATQRPDLQVLREEVQSVCSAYPDEYWRRMDVARSYPQEFVEHITRSGLLAALIPNEYGGRGLGMLEASVIVEEINRSGGHSGPAHAQMYTMGSLLRHGSAEQKARFLPDIASGAVRLQAFSVTEAAGSDTSGITTSARRDGSDFVVTGHKVWTSRVSETDLMLLLARTSEPGPRATDGLTLFLVDLREVRARQPEGIEIVPVRTMFNYATNQVFYKEMRIPAESVIGEIGGGFGHILDGMNAERIIVAAEAVGDGYWFVDRASKYAKERAVFGRPIGMNQGVQFPIVDAYMKVAAADLMRVRAAELFDAGHKAAAEANMAKLLASEASWAAANACLDTFGGFGFVDQYDVERKFRETRLYSVAPVSNNLVRSYVGTKVLGMPKSY